MAVEIIGAGVLGVVVILVLGGLLALSAVYLPRLLRLGEAGLEGKWGMGEMEPGLFEQAEPVPPPERERPAPVLPPREPLAARLGTGPEEPLLAAAIALALTLDQQEQRPVRQAETALPVGSPWALSGRWQAMQARINMQKR
ncbi:MAG: hypothetical protein HY790_11150 [Deltaproteobacteria bacterium]|nr:hypothetical protein [Deltaproteobacteria bacterium]MBI4796369.1 hypothetical protein [Deltaproteobacteria bacterium]